VACHDINQLQHQKSCRTRLAGRAVWATTGAHSHNTFQLVLKWAMHRQEQVCGGRLYISVPWDIKP